MINTNKTNKLIIEEKIKSLGYTLGGYSLDIDKVSKKGLNNILDKLGEWGNVETTIQGEKFIVEIEIWDNEIDLKMVSKVEYQRNYGR